MRNGYTCVEEGGSVINIREEMIRGLELISKVLVRLRNGIHLGSGGKAYRTEVMYIPTAPFYTITQTTTLPQAQSTPTFELSPADDNICVIELYLR